MRAFKLKWNVGLMIMTLWLAGCTTREQLRREQMVDNLSQQVAQGQKLSADVTARIQQLEEQVLEVSGKIEEGQYEQKRSQQKTIQDFEERLAALEEQLKSQDETLSALQKTTQEQKRFIKNITEALKKIERARRSSSSIGKNAYQKAMKGYKAGQYDKALPLLERLNDSGRLSGFKQARVLHHLGMISYRKKLYGDATIYFSKLVTQHPDNPNVSNGLLHLGRSFAKRGQKKDARSAFNTVIDRFPDHVNAKLAKKELLALK